MPRFQFYLNHILNLNLVQIVVCTYLKGPITLYGSAEPLVILYQY